MFVNTGKELIKVCNEKKLKNMGIYFKNRSRK